MQQHELTDLSQCEREPIRIPGAIQPHGRMVVADASGQLVAYSDNWRDLPSAGSALDKLNPLARSSSLEAAGSPANVGPVTIDGETFDALIHRSSSGHLVAELVPAEPQGSGEAPIHSLVRHLLPQLQRVRTLPALAQLAVAEMKRLTGFGRCLLYRFDREGHGEVLAELCEDNYQSYDGHRFPASDIPAQARELYRLNHIRIIPDARYRPAALLGARPGFDPRAIDLGLASLRSVSPVHLEYMINMGTLASMSVSIMVRGELWGLISCHDHEPKNLSRGVLAACEHLGELLSMQIEAKEDNQDITTRLELRKLTLEIVSNLAESDATLEHLVREPVPLLRMANATGAAVVLDEQTWTVGDVPSAESIVELAKWVSSTGLAVYHTERLRADFPAAARLADIPAGVLGLSISQVHRHVVMWFRPEIVQTIRWAGDPRKEVRTQDGRIHPRRSFASWYEQVSGHSLPWSQAQVAAAGELRQALIGIVLRRAQEMAEVATELGRVNKELEAFSYTVSHDLRAPMRHIAGYVDLVMDLDGAQLSERARRYLSHVKEASAYAGQLVDALLEFSRMGRSEIKRSHVDTQLLVDELVAEFSRHHPQRAIKWDIQTPLPVLKADPILLKVAVRNLLDNAVKYTRGREAARISVRPLRGPAGSGLEVEDNGVGFQMKYAGKLFGVFQRLHQAEEFEGTGIGLATVRRILERHGGEVRAWGESGRGARFSFTMPEEHAP